MKISFFTAILLISGLQLTIFSQIKPIESLKTPSNIKNWKYDLDVDKYSPLFIEVRSDNKVYKRERVNDTQGSDGQRKKNFEYHLLNNNNFIGEMNKYFSDFPKAPDKNWVYLKAAAEIKFGKLAGIFRNLAKSEVQPTRVQFIVNPLTEISENRQSADGGYVLTLNFPEKEIPQTNRIAEDEPPAPPVRLPPNYQPKPKTAEQIAAEEKARNLAKEKAAARKKIKIEKLSVELNDAGKVMFNNKPQTAAELNANLKKIFDERTYYEFFRSGANEIDNTVYLKISPNVKYGEAIKLIDEIYGLGANRIYLEDK